MLVERGELAYDLRVADVWPEFAAHGKDRVVVSDILLHTAGLPGLPKDTSAGDLCDWEQICAQLAAAEPWWEPGTKMGYHAQTFGFLLGETIRRATGRTLRDVLQVDIATPLGIADDLHFGVPTGMLSRVAHQTDPDSPLPQPEDGTPLARALPAGVRPNAALANRPDILTNDIPSFGTMTAAAVARMYSALLGHIPDIHLVSRDRLDTMAAVAFQGDDQVMGFPTTWAYGYSPGRPGSSASRPGSTFGMIGSNGSAAYADIDTGMTVAIMKNHINPDISLVAKIDDVIAAHTTRPDRSESAG